MLAVPVISSYGTELPAEFELVSLEVVREVNRIPFANLVLVGGDIPTSKFPALDSDALAPGAAIEIKVRVGDQVTLLFEGLVVRLLLGLAGGRPQLAVHCKDKAFRLTKPRRSAVYTDSSDADAIDTILRRAELEAGDLGAGGDVQPALVQYDASDWDFIVSRAEASGSVVSVTDGALSLIPLAVTGAAIHSFRLGIDDIEDFELELDAGGQFPDITAVGWDLPQGALTEQTAADPLELAQGNVDPADAGRSLGLEEAALRHLVPLTGAELKAWASARLAHCRLAMLRGRIAIGGAGDVAPMDLVELVGFGARFNGNALVSGVRHSVEESGWRTDLRLGLSPERFTQANDIVAAPAQGLLPAAPGLCIGVVAGYADDPDGEYRVRLTLPDVTAGDDELWARLAAPEAGNERGFFFRPDPGDEVVVGFLADDPRQPVVLGALFGSKNAPPSAFAGLSEDNIAKGLATKHGIALAFTDQDGKPIISMETPKGALAIDDDKGEIRLSDGNSNSIILSKDGITIKSGKDFKLEASGKVALKGATIDAN